MSVYILVHGAWGGSWCWKSIRRALQAQGHEVFTPSLSGVGERSHLLSRQLDLDTHIADVMNLIRWEELSDVVLCGHSYGGCVVTGVADRMPDRIRALVYVDAFVREDVDLGCGVVTRDEKLDESNHDASRRLVERMAQDPDQLRGYLNLIFVGRCLERVGDHATNIAEDAVYAAAAQDIRHPSLTATT